jgi:hypothetical protein
MNSLMNAEAAKELINSLLRNRPESEQDHIDTLVYKISQDTICQRIDGHRAFVSLRNANDLFLEEASREELDSYSEAQALFMRDKPETLKAFLELAAYRYINEHYEEIAEYEEYQHPPYAA